MHLRNSGSGKLRAYVRSEVKTLDPENSKEVVLADPRNRQHCGRRILISVRRCSEWNVCLHELGASNPAPQLILLRP